MVSEHNLFLVVKLAVKKARLTSVHRIACTFYNLAALDLSDVPYEYDGPKNGQTWVGYLEECMCYPLYTPGPKILKYFPYLERDEEERSRELARHDEFLQHDMDYKYRSPRPEEKYRPHQWYIKKDKWRTQQNSEHCEEFFWRLYEEQKIFEQTTMSKPPNMNQLDRNISRSHLFRRLKWLGLPDWRSDNKCAKVLGNLLPRWTCSLKTVSIRGKYMRDLDRNEVTSVHHHVCQLILGIELLPDSVTTLELRLSVSFLRLFLTELETRKPTIKRVGIDLGAWVQVFPLKVPSHKLADESIRARTRGLAHNEPKQSVFFQETSNFETYKEDETSKEARLDYVAEHLYRKHQPDFYCDRSGVEHPYTPVPVIPFAKRGPPPAEGEAPGKYIFYKDLMLGTGGPCPLDHARVAKELKDTRVNTLPKMLEKLHLARHVVGDVANEDNTSYRIDSEGKRVARFHIKRGGAHLFGLDGEKERRSFDPIHPLTLTQVESKSGVKGGRDYSTWSPDLLNAVYPWLEETFKWRPVFDWDWFMVPRDMVFTYDPSLVGIKDGINSSLVPEVTADDEQSDWQAHGKVVEGPIKKGKALEAALVAIKKQFAFLNEAGIPIHLLIGRRHPDVSSCYWGWPYTPRAWQDWKDEAFSTNLETIAQHVNILSIFYDLRNPLDFDRLSLIDAKRPQYGPEGQCPSRVCRLAPRETDKCPFVKKYPALKNYHPRPQTKAQRRPEKPVDRPGLQFPKQGYGGLSMGDPTAPPTGEHAEDYAKDDDSETEDNKQWPLHLARRSAWAREAVGWQRFWNVYATSFSNLTALRIRMPHSLDRAGSWRLARLLNKSNGWKMSTYTDERQHMQTEEDLLRDFNDKVVRTPASVYMHKKESRIWPAGRFVRRSWVWDPLRLVDDGYTRNTEIRQISIAGDEKDQVEAVTTGKTYPYRFEPRPRFDLTKADANVDAGEVVCYMASLINADKAIAAEIQNCDPRGEDGLPIKADNLRIPQPKRLPHIIVRNFRGTFKSTYGHHVRNVAGAQWREEIREMIAYADRTILELKGIKDGGSLENSLRIDREHLSGLLLRDPPYTRIFEVKEDQVRLRAVPDPSAAKPVDGKKDIRPKKRVAGDFPGKATADKNRKGNTEQDAYSSPYPLAGSDIQSATDLDSLFEDSEIETPEPNPVLPSPPSSSPPVPKRDFQKAPAISPFVDSESESSDKDAKPDAGHKIGEAKGMSSMDWLSQRSAAANVSIARSSTVVLGGNVASGTKRKKSTTAAPGTKATTSSRKKGKASQEVVSATATRTKFEATQTIAEVKVSTKRPQAVETIGRAEERSIEEAKGSEPATPAPEPVSTSKLSKAGKKRKAPAVPTEDSPGPAKKIKTRSGRIAKIYDPSQDEDEEDASPDEEIKRQARVRRTRSQADWVPAGDAVADDEDEEEEIKPAKKKSARKDNTDKSVPSAFNGNGVTIHVPFKTDGSGEFDYKKLTVKNLKALAKERGILLKGITLKDAIIKRFVDEDDSREGLEM